MNKREKRKKKKKKRKKKRGRKKRAVATCQRSMASTRNAFRLLYTRLHIEWIKETGRREREKEREKKGETLVAGATRSRTYRRGLIKPRLVCALFSFPPVVMLIPETKANAPGSRRANLDIDGRGGPADHRLAASVWSRCSLERSLGVHARRDDSAKREGYRVSPTTTREPRLSDFRTPGRS